MPATEKEIVHAVADAIIANKDYLTELDTKIGDGDHGINMARGFEAVVEAVDKMEDTTDLVALFNTIGHTLLETVGGASGPLYGTGFIQAAKAVEPHPPMTVANVEKVLGAVIEGIKHRGRADKGDKTMLDVLIPIREALKNSAGKSLIEVLMNASVAANKGLEYTKTIAAKRGRASYIGDRSIGTEDPGAASSLIMFRAFVTALR